MALSLGARALTLALALSLVAGARAEEMATEAVAVQTESVKPLYVRPLFAESGYGHNDSSPIWAGTTELLAIERSEESKREIVIAKAGDGSLLKNVYYQTDEDDLGLGALLPGLGQAVSYNAGIAWSPRNDQFVFMSNAGEGNYDLYLGDLANKAVKRLTTAAEKDGQPSWSPKSGAVVFVSGRDGGAQLFLLHMESGQVDKVSASDKSYLYPRWSPDGKRIAAIRGDNENHDIVVLENLPAVAVDAKGVPRAVKTGEVREKAYTTWEHDDLSPSWSPDGKKIAFYTNYNPEGDPKVWSLVVIAADGSSAREGEALVTRVVAHNVIPDVASGPAWMPDSERIAYVGNDKQDYSPIYVVNVTTRKIARVETGTNINHDLSVSATGVMAFRSQVDQWDQIFLAKLPEVVQ